MEIRLFPALRSNVETLSDAKPATANPSPGAQVDADGFDGTVAFEAAAMREQAPRFAAPVHAKAADPVPTDAKGGTLTTSREYTYRHVHEEVEQKKTAFDKTIDERAAAVDKRMDKDLARLARMPAATRRAIKDDINEYRSATAASAHAIRAVDVADARIEAAAKRIDAVQARRDALSLTNERDEAKARLAADEHALERKAELAEALTKAVVLGLDAHGSGHARAEAAGLGARLLTERYAGRLVILEARIEQLDSELLETKNAELRAELGAAKADLSAAQRELIMCLADHLAAEQAKMGALDVLVEHDSECGTQVFTELREYRRQVETAGLDVWQATRARDEALRADLLDPSSGWQLSYRELKDDYRKAMARRVDANGAGSTPSAEEQELGHRLEDHDKLYYWAKDTIVTDATTADSLQRGDHLAAVGAALEDIDVAVDGTQPQHGISPRG